MTMISGTATILVVDDVPQNVEILSMILQPHYRVQAATSGKRALEICFSNTSPDLILLDIVMPGLSGYDVCKALKQDVVTADIPIIFVTANDQPEDETYGFEIGALDYIAKPVNPAVVRARVKNHLELQDQRYLLQELVRDKTREIGDSRIEMVRRLALAAEFKDNETGMHVTRMSHYSRLLGELAGMSEYQRELLFNAAPMHDLGKIGIPDKILLKPGRLDPVERKIMEEHAEIGSRILDGSDCRLLNMASEIALTHHEKWDGSGYPNGLAGKDIPLVGRIVALADVFDALASERPYKNAWPIERIQEYFVAQSALHFDPELLALLLDNMTQVIEIKTRFDDPKPETGGESQETA